MGETTGKDGSMSITNELREWAVNHRAELDMGHLYPAMIECIADRIDEKYDEVCDFCERLEGAATDREDVTLWGVDYTALPLDADGVPIHIGDVMEACYNYQLSSTPEVRAMRYGEGGWEVYDRLGDRYHPSSLRHHHAPTVEDVLCDLLGEWSDEGNDATPTELAEKYAKRLTLADGEGA